MLMAKVKAIPEGYHNVTSYLVVDGAAKAIDFSKKTFGAVEKMRMPGPGGKVGHAELTLGDSMIMLADEHPEMGHRGPHAYNGSAITLMVYVPDVDATVKTAVANGAKVIRPLENQFYGDRMATLEDPFGHHWHVATHVEDVPPDELARRAAAVMGKKPGAV
jgi:PhnB protein